MTTLPYEEQVRRLLEFLRTKPETTEKDETFDKVVKWLADLPPSVREMKDVETTCGEVCRVYQITPERLNTLLQPPSTTRSFADFEPLVPEYGWLREYVEYTRNTEPPTVFHFFAGLVALGSTMARNTWFDKGPYQIYPNMCVVIVAPTGKCRKTSACNIAIKLMRDIEAAPILADKVTPEALITTFEGKDRSCGLIYAPELAVFLGRQKYQEGMVPLLTALFDCPTEWSSRTITRSETKIFNVGLSFLGCSTLDWIQTAIPKDAFGGGFMSRLLFVVQDDTPRRFAIPPPMDQELAKRLRDRLLKIQKVHGSWSMTEDAYRWYHAWYEKRGDENTENKQFAGYYERKPDHLIRMAMCIASSFIEHEDVKLCLTKDHLLTALSVMDWMEKFLPGTFDQMQSSASGEDRERLLRQIRKHKGVIDHSKWLRLNSSKMNSLQFKQIVNTLIEEKLVKQDPGAKNMYYLMTEGW